MKKTIWVLNGPNLNFTGIREPEIYGRKNYAQMVRFIKKYAKTLSVRLRIYQTNDEGKLIDLFQKAYRKKVLGIVLNAGALTHYSYSLRDAITAVGIPTAEVHLSDPEAREAFRRISVIGEVCAFTVKGKGFESYTEALRKLAEENRDKK